MEIKEPYSDVTIHILNTAKIEWLVAENIKLRVNYGLKKLTNEEMLICALEMYNRSIKSRLKKRKND